MGYPVIERIAQQLEARLGKMAAGLTLNTKVSEVYRSRRNNKAEPKDRQIIITQPDPERIPDSDCAGNPPAIAWKQPFHCIFIAMTSEDDPTELDQTLNFARADMQTAIAQPSANWQGWNNLAFNSEFAGSEKLDAGGGVHGLKLVLHVFYRHNEGDEYTARL